MQECSSGMDPTGFPAWSGACRRLHSAGLKDLLGAVRDDLEVLVKSKAKIAQDSAPAGHSLWPAR